MSEFFIDLLPADAARLARHRTRFRTMLLTSALAGTTIIGMATHSFVQQRNASISHQVASDLTRNVQDLSDMISPLQRERDHLFREMTAARTLAMPVQSSDVLATVTHLMPERMVLTALTISLESQANPAFAAATKPGAKRPKVPDPQSISPVISILRGEIRGVAPDNRSIDELANLLSRTPPFLDVNVEDTRSASGNGGDRDFTLTFAVDPWATREDPSSRLARLTLRNH
ncbi:MAG: hypothetical protein O2819_00935 [Planctomycetota bacterium]|nr:hypothetical protein [Planctomycetota bacterium]MDA1105653.1 hypothetical protein [Planctomycetota bacterium]